MDPPPPDLMRSKRGDVVLTALPPGPRTGGRIGALKADTSKGSTEFRAGAPSSNGSMEMMELSGVTNELPSKINGDAGMLMHHEQVNDVPVAKERGTEVEEEQIYQPPVLYPSSPLVDSGGVDKSGWSEEGGSTLRLLTDTPIDDLKRVVTGDIGLRAHMLYARNLISKASLGYDVPRLLELEGRQDWDRRKMFLIYDSKQFKWLVFSAIYMNMFLVLLEAPVVPSLSPAEVSDLLISIRSTILLCEWLCMCVHLLDFVVFVKTQTLSSLSAIIMSDVRRLLLLFVLIADMFSRSFVWYNTGCIRPKQSLAFQFSDYGVLGVPVTAVLRPLLLVFRSPTVRRSFWDFLVTLWDARNVAALLFIIVAVASASGCALFFNAPPMPQMSNGFFLNLVDMFSFIGTADNYTDIMVEPLGWSLLYGVFFIFFSVAGVFLVGPLFITVFIFFLTS